MSNTSSNTHHSVVADHYGPRAGDYVTSAVHAAGADLDQIEGLLRGRLAARVLDLGCGGGHVSYRAAPHVAEVVAVDVTAEMLDSVTRTAAERGLTNIRTQQAPAERLPFPDGHFDVVLSRFSTHHWLDAEAGLREARRVLAPDGMAVFADVIAPAQALLDTHFQAVELLRDPSHVRNLSVAEWTAALARAGFAVTGLTTRRLRMEFASWTARTRTPEVHARAIRSLQDMASDEVRRHFAIEPDGSFMLDATVFETVPL
ncbi:class I SAM-dependent methyltransferase [Azospirillum canadense]|uniref:class I SAM-dependent methyltransferase n=1 Tax=Azospirillum canadense TaxID=403962 RepID=UPI0022274794|nr:class I SAM-dependent methyltransferase [Azospirillum canadense]MCW2243493.1 SAM-dependent methyltransferase [Azospirillum canadense]